MSYPVPTRYLAGFSAVVLSSVLFACKGPLIKIAYELGLDPVTVMAGRLLFAMPIFLVVALVQLFRRTHPSPLGVRDWVVVSLLGFTGYYLASYLDLVGLQYVSAGLERLILYSYPAFVVVIGLFLPGAKPSLGILGPLALSYGGIALAFADGAGIHPEKGYFGATLILLSAFSYAVYLVGYGRYVVKIGASRLAGYAMLVSGGTFLGHFCLDRGMDSLRFTPEILLLLLVLAFFSTVIPVYLFGYGVRLIGSTRASIASCSSPLAAFLMGWLLWGDTIRVTQLAGMALVAMGIVWLGRFRVG